MSRQKLRSLRMSALRPLGRARRKPSAGERILGAQEAEALNQPTNESIHRDQALGFQLAEGHMDGPALLADQAETIEG